MKTSILLFLLVVVVFLTYVRLAPSNAGDWHVDPLTAKKGRKKNVFLLHPDTKKHPAPEYAMDAMALAKALETLALKDGDVQVLAGAASDGFVTYIARTPVMRYPDYISIRFIDLGAGRSTLAIFSRSRFGYSDRGVNRRRVLGWLDKLQP